MSGALCLVLGVAAALAGVCCAWACLICRGRGMHAADGRSALIAAAVLLALAVLSIGAAVGQDHHPLHRDFYRHWMQPGVHPPLSCCNARVEVNGIESGDCEPTRGRIRNGQWQAWIRQTGRWLPVPDEKIVREPNPNIFDAHVCWTAERGIICFKPEDTGG